MAELLGFFIPRCAIGCTGWSRTSGKSRNVTRPASGGILEDIEAGCIQPTQGMRMIENLW